MRVTLPFIGLLILGAAGAALRPSIVFESNARVVAEGRDPVVSVRASGALSLLKVDKGNLWLVTSLDGGDSFEEPVRVNDIAGEVSSHGESSPQMQVRTRSEFYCLWQTRKGEGEGSGLRFSRSMNWGESFSKAIDVDTGSTSQGFYTMNVSPKGAVYAAWLDGRERGKGKPGSSAVYIAKSSNKGQSFEKSIRVALDVCPCCRPSIGFGNDGSVYVSWRAVLDNNVRDVMIAASRDEGATWGAPVRVAEDNWVINGCPHSGAAIGSIGKRLFIAWHAVREKQPGLSLAYSDDGGKTFSRRIPVAEGVLDANHPFMSKVGDNLGIVFQGRPSGKQEGWAPLAVYYREIDADGKLTSAQMIKPVAGSVSYPVFTFEDPERLFVAWTEPHKDGKAVALARGRRSTTTAPATAGGANNAAR